MLLYLADESLTAVLADEGTQAEELERRRVAAEALAGVRRAVGELGPRRKDTVEKWYVRHLQRAVDAADVWLDLVRSEQGLVVRGRLWLDLARQYAGYSPDGQAASQAAGWALRAAEDLKAAVGASVLPDDERCRIWLDVADAVEIEQFLRHGDRMSEALLDAVGHARRAARDDVGLILECLVRIGGIHNERYERTGELHDLERAIAAWTDAVPLLDEDDSLRSDLLATLGIGWLQRAVRPDSADDVVNRAIDVLRLAVEESPPDYPLLPMRRRHLADAYVMRYDLTHVLTDLYEADWLLAEAARGSEDAVLRAECLSGRGRVASMLYERTEVIAHLHKAIEFFSQAIEHAEEAGDNALVAAALMGRGQARELQGRPSTARSDYEHAGRLTADRDRPLRRHISRLSPETADE
ncbi:hypothetical protein [Streptomyces sp. T21Q-yed]|uniref:hypothetical protein n=1 Tax=Streptomyces sp. T21Q-yed TaxID=3018441 RepID=UPI0023DF7CCA|nr:hypothetical protein [Streptomyces sp. T21Q-yed]MDF3149484.1 hypothetical protein [Streptomyces sp. T21Q-yed]